VKLLASRAECQTWVKTRACRPGDPYDDGCNTGTCDLDGRTYTTTLLLCETGFLEQVHFAFASTQLAPGQQEWLAEVAIALDEALAKDGRDVELVGYASDTEAKTEPVRRRLALARAEVVKRALVSAGLSPDRVRVKAGPRVIRQLDGSPVTADGKKLGDASIVRIEARDRRE
jgi:outer membrane protein OmpA-like peptidoglycan-associated protein